MKILASLLAVIALAFTSCARHDTRGSTDSSDSSSSGATDSTVGTTSNSTTSGNTTAGSAMSSDTAGTSASEQPSGAGSTSASISASNASSTQPSSTNWNELRSYGYEQRGEFNSALNAMSARVDAEISQLRSSGNQNAVQQVERAKQNFDEKSAALARASQDNWNRARDEAAQAWQNLQQQLAQARSNR